MNNNKTKLKNFIDLHGEEKAAKLFDKMLEVLENHTFVYDDEGEGYNNDDVIDLLKEVGDWNDKI